MSNNDVRTEKIFSANLVWLMRKHNESQAELARASGVVQQLISKYARGKCLPSLENILRIAQHYCTTVEDLLTLHYRLETCPFCGAEANLEKEEFGCRIAAKHEEGCYLYGHEIMDALHKYYKTPEEAMQAWNRRAN